MSLSGRLRLRGAPVVLASAVLVGALAYLTFAVPGWRDDEASLSLPAGSELYRAAARIAQTADSRPMLVGVVALVVFAIAARRWRAGLVAVATFALANALTQALQAALTQPRPLADGTTLIDPFPSGHGTAALALVVGLAIVAPRAGEALAAGLPYALAVSWGVIVLRTHLIGDVVAAWAVVAATTAVTTAVLPSGSVVRRGALTESVLGPLAVVALVLAATPAQRPPGGPLVPRVGAVEWEVIVGGGLLLGLSVALARRHAWEV